MFYLLTILEFFISIVGMAFRHHTLIYIVLSLGLALNTDYAWVETWPTSLVLLLIAVYPCARSFLKYREVCLSW